MKYEEIENFLGKKVVCKESDNCISSGIFKEVTISKKYINVAKCYHTFESSNWIEVDEVVDMEILPEKKKKGWLTFK